MANILWTEAEDEILRRQYPQRATLTVQLPGRTWKAIKRRASKIGVAKPLNRWTARQDRDLERAIKRGAGKHELLALFPGRTYVQIADKAKYLNVKIKKAAILASKFAAKESMRRRARQLGVSFKELDRRIGRPICFGEVHHRPATRSVVAATEILGGQITIVWDED